MILHDTYSAYEHAHVHTHEHAYLRSQYTRMMYVGAAALTDVHHRAFQWVNMINSPCDNVFLQPFNRLGREKRNALFGSIRLDRHLTFLLPATTTVSFRQA